MKSELKPCPFCGGEALLERGSDHHGKWFNLGCSRHWGAVADPDEGCIGGRLFYTETEKDEAEAITAWNTRASDAEITRLTEALRAAEEREKALREALVATEGAIAEYYRYWTGGETRGSYDGKPERAGLWKAQQIARQAIAAALKEQPHD